VTRSTDALTSECMLITHTELENLPMTTNSTKSVTELSRRCIKTVQKSQKMGICRLWQNNVMWKIC